MAKVLQANLNRSRPAQDLALQTMVEEEMGIALFSEQSMTPKHPHWVGSTDGLGAVHWRPRCCPNPCKQVAAGVGYAAAQLGTYVVFSCYFSSNRDLADFEEFLERLRMAVRPFLPGMVMVGSDFNAKSPVWGCPRRDPQGRLLETWATGLGLVALNVGTSPTCVRPQGSSIVDVT